MRTPEDHRQKRLDEEAASIESWPVEPEFEHAVAKAAHLRLTYRPQRSRPCDLCGGSCRQTSPRRQPNDS